MRQKQGERFLGEEKLLLGHITVSTDKINIL